MGNLSINTSSQLRIANRQKVFHTLYEHTNISKQDLCQLLSMSLPTVTQNLKELEALGLVERRGLYESTGGRKAQIYHFNASARIAIGVVLLKEMYRITAIDLYGHTLLSEVHPVYFSRTKTYWSSLGDDIRQLIAKISDQPQQILGVVIALQGLVSTDGTSVLYGEILECTGLSLDEIQPWIPFPCTLMHDTEASAIAESWVQKDLKDAVLLSLTRNFGGALILNGEVHRGHSLSSSVIEHMRLHPNGLPCYCGKRGCIEAYCSAHALSVSAGESIENFFLTLRAGDTNRRQIWETYLHNLALAINNIRMILDCDYIIGGYLLFFMTEDDFILLERYVNEECSFESAPIHLKRSVFSEDSAAPGAAISLIKKFLRTFEF